MIWYLFEVIFIFKVSYGLPPKIFRSRAKNMCKRGSKKFTNGKPSLGRYKLVLEAQKPPRKRREIAGSQRDALSAI